MRHNDRPLPSVRIPIDRRQSLPAPDDDLHSQIRETYTKLIGPIVPETHNVRIFVNLESNDDAICIQYLRTWACELDLNRLIEVGAHLCNIGGYDWDASPLIMAIFPSKPTGHELIELHAQIQSLPPRLRYDDAYAHAKAT